MGLIWLIFCAIILVTIINKVFQASKEPVTNEGAFEELLALDTTAWLPIQHAKAAILFLATVVGLNSLVASKMDNALSLSTVVAMFIVVRAWPSLGPSEDDLKWTYLLLPTDGLTFRSEERDAKVDFKNVDMLKVYLAFGTPKKMVFEMKDGQRHEVKFYSEMRQVLEHCQSNLSHQQIRLISYT